MKAYSNSPKYLELQFIEGHEPSGESVNTLDSPMENFLNWIEEEKLVNR